MDAHGFSNKNSGSFLGSCFSFPPSVKGTLQRIRTAPAFLAQAKVRTQRHGGDLWLRRGFSKFHASAEKTEQAAHEGRIGPGGGYSRGAQRAEVEGGMDVSKAVVGMLFEGEPTEPPPKKKRETKGRRQGGWPFFEGATRNYTVLTVMLGGRLGRESAELSHLPLACMPT